MKIANGNGNGARPVKGSFGPEVGSSLIVDFTQGPFGRVLCGAQDYDLPDPARMPLSIDNKHAAVEIIAPPALNQTASARTLNVATAKIRGNLSVEVLRTRVLSLDDACLKAHCLSGPLDGTDDPPMEPQTIREVALYNSVLRVEGELNVATLVAEEHFPARVQAGQIEAMGLYGGDLEIEADAIVAGVIEAQKILTHQPAGCRIAQIYCPQVLSGPSPSEGRPDQPVYDPEIADFLNYHGEDIAMATPTGIDLNGP